MDTEFDGELAGTPADSMFAKLYEGDPPSRLVFVSRDFGVLVDIAPLVVGHVLVVPKRKALSFASLTDAEWDGWLIVRERLVAGLISAFGLPVTLVEHGSVPAAEANACILHAHMHMLPLPEGVTLDFASDGLEPREIEPSSLRGAVPPDVAYFYAERIGGSAVLAEVRGDNRPPSQYLRRVIQRQIGDPDQFDWGVSVERERLRKTLDALGRI